MLAIDVLEDFEALLNKSDDDVVLSKQVILEIISTYKDDLEKDNFGEDGKQARVQHYYSG